MGMMKTIALSCLLAFARAAPAAEAEADADADAQYFGYAAHTAPLAHAVAAPAVAPVAYHAAPAPTCVTEDVILVTQVCTPTAEEVCSTETVATQEIEYEKVCTEIVDTLCDAPVAAVAPAAYHAYGKRRLMPRLRLRLMLMLSTSPPDTMPPMPLPLL